MAKLHNAYVILLVTILLDYFSDLTLSLTTSQLPAYLFIGSKNWRHSKVAHVLVKKSVKLLWKDDPCHVKKQFLTSEELDILLSKNCSIHYLLLILWRTGVKPMTFWSQLCSDPLPLIEFFGSLPKNAMQVTKVLVVNMTQPQKMITGVRTMSSWVLIPLTNTLGKTYNMWPHTGKRTLTF